MSVGEVRPKADRNREDRLRYAAKARGLRAKKHHRGGSAIPLRELQRQYGIDKEKIRKNRGALALGLRELHMPEKQVRAEFTGVHWSGEPLWTLFDLDKPLITGTIDDVEQHLAELSDETGEGTTIEHPDGDVWVMSD
jgi:hypothetical protein